ncbi:MAG: hypothetical protein Q4E94_06930 [Clostridia bacterium]|nr:hypothetical protein [Clostridia bacterium]
MMDFVRQNPMLVKRVDKSKFEEANQMQDIGKSMLWFWTGYILVTVIGIIHTIFNIYVMKMSAMDENSMGEGYERTKPWHPLYNIVLFSLFGWLYMKGLLSPSFSEALITGVIWVAICIVFDVFGWVIIKHPWSLSFKEFYVDYQPWITLIYLSIFSGPIIGYLLTMM